jgi:hypothetical protein
MSWYQSFEYCLNERPFVMRSIFNYLYKQRKIRSIHSLRSVQLSVQSLEERAVPATFIVTSNGDNGAGTFREALSLSNGSPGADIIRFNIGTGQQSIALASALPDVSDAVTIDATTQPGYSGSPIIELNGANAGGSATGLKVTS